MFDFFKKISKHYMQDSRDHIDRTEKIRISSSLDKILDFFRNEFDQSADLVVREIRIANLKAAVIIVDGLIDKNTFSINVLKVIMNKKFLNDLNVSNQTPEKIFETMRDDLVAFPDQIEVFTYEDALNLVTCGFALVALDGSDKILALGVQGYFVRGLAEPTAEKSQRGCREGFIEAIRVNMTMIRRRIRSPKLKFENLILGSISQTYVSMCYLTSMADTKIIEEIKKRLSSVDIETITTAGCISPFLEAENDLSLFSSVGFSERPDTVCGKISEGRVAILIDGIPTVLIVPYLFVENFQNIDDYALRPYFASFNRILKFFSFLVSILLPGMYVALGTFNPELFPGEILNKIALATGSTPFSMMTETLLIHFIYEVVREAGLRLPQTLAHAVSIVGGLVIGQTAIDSGLIGGPTLMIVALTAISSYVIPNLYEPITFLRLIFIISGGILGIWGIMMFFTAMLINICSKTNFGIPFTAPIAPFDIFGMRDVFLRFSWKILSKKENNIQSMPGTKI
ncbi:MAG: spore germination protein [Candidatus Improbicoccus pseudotrichonymphae]|uniref:Spore germination protein n=1 Tax=Candidatus Improbicoccus pseudotrichonymphae TaxID=3033792 RepID=A0AA48KV49_9FIRM|nr:MAG: spore germination protein [Candidatus Improbicoccus pseudotrichonymphae]